jgi:Fanconi anemia group M protein
MSSDSDLKFVEHPLIWPDTVESRLYQTKIAEVASERNTLVILPTALGKTVIAAIAVAEILYNYRNVKVLVMAPTRPLVMQHRRRFTAMLKLGAEDTALLTGKTPPGYRMPVWDGDARVLFSTPQVVKNDLLAKRLTLKEYGLLVFDECHRAVKKYAYTSIAKYYLSQAEYPLVLGMTASPGSDTQRVLDVCRNLFIEHIEYRNEEDPDVQPYLQPIDVKWKRVDLPQEYVVMKSLIRTMLNKRLLWLYKRGIIKSSPTYATRRSLIEAGKELRLMLEERDAEERGGIFTAIINQALALTLFHMLELLETQGVWTLNVFLSKVAEETSEKRSYAILVNEPEYLKLTKAIDSTLIDHPKKVLLKRLVGEVLATKPSSRILVFTQYRATANHLVSELNAVQGVRANRFVGQASTLLDKGLTQEEQAARIEQLEDGSLNVLVATSIAEEGLDIPAVDQVFFYEPIPSEIRYIQRRGRTGRKAPGKVTILATNNSLDMIYLYASRRRIKKMQRIAENVNRKLQPIIRINPKPLPNKLTPAELEAVEEKAYLARMEPEIIKTEAEALKALNMKVTNASRKVYTKLLERGVSGLSMDQLALEMEREGFNTKTVKGSIRKLISEQIVKEKSRGAYVATASMNPSGKTFEVTIEKIVPGSALVLIDNQLRARLLPEDYEGPRNLIKKNSRFRASANLYRVEGSLYIRVKDVTEILT